jgi:hypothetical protein
MERVYKNYATKYGPLCISHTLRFFHLKVGAFLVMPFCEKLFTFQTLFNRFLRLLTSKPPGSPFPPVMT